MEYCLKLNPFHGAEIYFSIIYNKDMDKYNFNSATSSLSDYFNISRNYSKYEILNIFEINYKFNFTSNSTHRRYYFYIDKKLAGENETIFEMDTELHGNVSSYNEKVFTSQFRRCFEFVLDLVKEISIIPQTLTNKQFIINVTGAQCNMDMFIKKKDNDIYYIIKNNMIKNEPMIYLENIDILKKYIKNQIRFSRYLKTQNNTIDYYPKYGHDSKELLIDIYKYLHI